VAAALSLPTTYAPVSAGTMTSQAASNPLSRSECGPLLSRNRLRDEGQAVIGLDDEGGRDLDASAARRSVGPFRIEIFSGRP